jgi:hypothetical protein
MVLGLIAFGLAVLAGCAAEEDIHSGPTETDPVMHVNSADALMTPETDSHSGRTAAEPMEVNSAAAVTPRGDSHSEPSESEPIMDINSADTLTPEGNYESGPIASGPVERNSADVSVTGAEDFQSGQTEAKPIIEDNSGEVPTVTPEGVFESAPGTEPSIRFNFEGVMEDVMTVTPKGEVQNELTEAEPTYSPI